MADGGGWHAALHGSQRVGHDLVAEQQQLLWEAALSIRFCDLFDCFCC